MTFPTDAQTVTTIAALTDLTGMANGAVAQVLGYYAAGDGGGGLFRYDSASDSASGATVNGGTILAPGVGSGRWLRVMEGQLWAEFFGVLPSAPSDTARLNSMNAALTYARANSYNYVHIGTGNFHMDGQLQANAVTIVGEGQRYSRLTCSATLGVGVPFINQPVDEATEFKAVGLRDLTVTSTTPRPAIGSPRSGVGDGVYVGASHHYENVEVKWFDRGFVVDSTRGHVSWVTCRVINNFYGVYFLNSVANSDFFMTDGQVEANSFADIAVQPNQPLDHLLMLRMHMGNSPFAFYKEPYVSGTIKGFIENSTFQDVQFETMGNAIAYWDKAGEVSGDHGLWAGNKFIDCGYAYSVGVKHPSYNADWMFRVGTMRNSCRFEFMQATNQLKNNLGFLACSETDSVHVFDFRRAHDYVYGDSLGGPPKIVVESGIYSGIKIMGPRIGQNFGSGSITGATSSTTVDMVDYVGPVAAMQIGLQLTNPGGVTDPVLYVSAKDSNPDTNTATFTVTIAGSKQPGGGTLTFDWWLVV
jgi:hypothetical protein